MSQFCCPLIYFFWFLLFDQGANFSEVIQMTDIFEGSIIRLARRLDEFLNQVSENMRILFLSCTIDQ